MRHRGQTPGAHGKRVGPSPAHSINNPPRAQIGKSRCELENGGEMAVVAVAPMQILLQQGLKHGDDLSIRVIEYPSADDEREEQSTVNDRHRVDLYAAARPSNNARWLLPFR